MRVDVPDAPRWRRARRRRGLLRQTVLRTRLATATSKRPIHLYPRLTSGQSLHSCALAHTGRLPFQVVPPIPVHRACRGRGKGGTRGGRLTAGESGRGEAHSLQGDSPSPAPTRRFAGGACGRWAQHTQNGPPSVASRKYEPPVRCPARGACRLPSPWASPLPPSTQRDAQGWAKRRVVARCGGQGRTRRPPHTFGSCAYSGGSPFPTPGEPGARERASPHG